ncbi:MAG: beta-galactosidase trimerization domain-containing protein, partial [Armatimonadota bacterium]
GVPGARSEVPLGSWIGSGVDSPDISKLPPGERRIPTHMESAVGVFRAMMEDHLPLDIVIEQDVEDIKTLRNYKVLILPDATCLSQKANDTIRAFVKGGGGLVSLHESSLCNEFGDRQKDFGLADVFGAHYKASEDFSARWPNYVKITEFFMGYEGDLMKEICDDPVVKSNYRRGGDRLNYIGWATNVEAEPTAKVLGNRLGTPAWPVMVMNTVGKGRSAFIAADLGQSYFLAPYQYQRRFITNAVRWATKNNPSPATVEAPLCVQAAYYTQNEGKRKIVHLLNQMNTSASSALPENNPPMREDIVPITGIKVTMAGTRIKTAFQEPEHVSLPLKKTAKGVEVTVPKVDIHSMVVFE